MTDALANGRYVLLLDILGFSRLVETHSASEGYDVIDSALADFERWEQLNGFFRTIYFADTFVFYQEPKGYAARAFLDVYAIGSFLLSALLARGIPARGAITFGEFEVQLNRSGEHQIFVGRALVEAHQAEQKENWIGISVQPSAWEPYERESPGTIDAFAADRVWLKRQDGALLLNPFVKLRGWYSADLVGEIDRPYLEWDAPDFANDIRAFQFLRTQSDDYASRGDFTSRDAMKYHATVAFLKIVLAPDLYDWGVRVSEEAH